MANELPVQPSSFVEPERPDTSDAPTHDPAWRTYNKYRMKKFPGRKVTLPLGTNLEASRWANVRPPGQNEQIILHSPEKLLKNPKHNCKYIGACEMMRTL